MKEKKVEEGDPLPGFQIMSTIGRKKQTKIFLETLLYSLFFQKMIQIPAQKKQKVFLN